MRARRSRGGCGSATPSSASGSTKVGTSASPMPFLRVGEKVPEVISPSGTSAVEAAPACPGRGMPRPGGDQAAQQPRRARPPSRRRARRWPQNASFFQPTAQPSRAWLGVTSRRDVLAVQRVAHLGAQRVAGAEAARAASRAARPAASSASHSAPAHVVARDQLVAALAGVAGAAHDDAGRPSNVRLDEGHVVVPGRAARRRRAPRRTAVPCTASTAYVVVVVGDRHARRARRPASRRTTSAVLAAFGTRSTWSSSWR